MRWEVDSICMHCFYCTYSNSFNIFASQSCKVQQDSSQIRKHVLTVNLCLDHVKHMCWKLWLTQMQNNGDAHIYTGTSLSHTSLQWSLTGRDQRLGGPRKLTELSPGLLQLLDLVLQEEHGHCERQQRQKLQLGRHHDSEQPHQIIQREMMVTPCSEEEEETPKTHTQQRRWWLQSGWECVHGPLSLSLNLSPSVCVDISQRSDPVVTSNATCSNSAWLFHSVKSRQSGRRGRRALEISPEYVFVPPGFVRDGTSRCRLRPPHRGVPSQPVCSQPHHGHTVTTTQAIGCINSPPHSWDLPFVDSLCLFLSDWTVFRCGTQNWTPGVALPLATMKWPRWGRISLGWLGLCQNTKKHKIKKKYYFLLQIFTQYAF